MKIKKIKYKKDVRNKTGLMLFLLFTCFTLCLSVGYAALNSDLKISGEANFRVQADIRITDISLYETTNLAVENYTSKYSKDTITIGVGLKQIDSSISYKVKVQNSGTVAMWIDSIEEEAKNNSNTEYVLEGIGLKELINPGEEKEFIVKIKYKDNVTVLPDNTNIDTILKFNFIKPESTLTMGNSGASTTTFYNGPITKEEVESIEFVPTLDVVEDAIGYWDASQSKNKTVIASYKDADGNGLYELYIGGIGIVNAPINSSYLFCNFTNLKTIDFGKYFNTKNVTNMSNMFNECLSLISLDLSSFDTSRVTTMAGMFMSLYNKMKIASLNLSSFDTSKVTGMNYMFYNCSLLTKLDVSSFDTSNVTNMAWMFGGMSSLKSLDLSNFNTSKVTNMNQMFFFDTALLNLDVSSFDTSNVTAMSDMFRGVAVKELDLSHFNTSKVVAMDRMFMGSGISTLDLSSFDTSNVTSMSGMFYQCSNLTKLDLSNFDTSNVTNMSNMFFNTKYITELDLSSFDFSNVTNSSNMFFNFKSNSLIYVKDETSKDFILNARSDLSNVQIKEA